MSWDSYKTRLLEVNKSLRAAGRMTLDIEAFLVQLERAYVAGVRDEISRRALAEKLASACGSDKTAFNDLFGTLFQGGR